MYNQPVTNQSYRQLAPVNPNFRDKFQQSEEIGAKGETLFMVWMEGQHPNVEVTDVSKNPEYRRKDIDFLFRDRTTGIITTVELKTDLNDWSANYAIETTANKEIGRQGWLYYSECKVLAYFYLNGLKSGEPNLYFLDMDQLRETVAANAFQEKEAKAEQQLRNEGKKTTIVTLVPRSRVKPLKSWFIPTSYTENPHSASADYRARNGM